MSTRANKRLVSKMRVALFVSACLYVYVNKARGPKVVKRILEDSSDKQKLVKKIVFNCSVSPNACIERYRLSPAIFRQILSLFENQIDINGDGIIWKSITLPLYYQLAMYMCFVGHNPSMSLMVDLFAVSNQSILKARRNITHAINKFIYPQVVTPIAELPDLESYTYNNKLGYFKEFQGVGYVWDGTHIPIEGALNENNDVNMRNYKKFLSTNALLCVRVGSSLLIQYALVGADGAASDATIYRYKNMTLLPGGMSIGDAIFPLSVNMLSPYRGVAYHRSDYDGSRIDKKPQNKEEYYNLKHNRLRNPVERTNGVLKNRFRVLRGYRCKNLNDCYDVIYSCFALHNLIRLYDSVSDDVIYDGNFFKLLDDALQLANNRRRSPKEIIDENNSNNKVAAKLQRNQIAQKIWDGKSF